LNSLAELLTRRRPGKRMREALAKPSDRNFRCSQIALDQLGRKIGKPFDLPFSTTSAFLIRFSFL